jgi:uncharacterized protein YdiU (UPF0061 family)
MKINLNNTYKSLGDKFFQLIQPDFFKDPSLIIFNHGLAKYLGIEYDNLNERELAQYFSGQKLIEGSQPMALAYAGFQFGHPVMSLGDGRAHLLGEVNGHDIQLKGSGRTAFSRRGDGRSALGPVLREYLISEFMNRVGVPTTRALAALRTGEEVYRQDGAEPGGILVRVALSHIRVGTFQYFYFKQDFQALEQLFNYTVDRHYPEINQINNQADRVLALLKSLINKQAELIAKWMGLGFIHGVMNTDNFSMAGITLDYGPCAFMDEFSFDRVFSSIDQQGRYRFVNQVPIAQWNILRLADCLLFLIDNDQTKAVERIQAELSEPMQLFEAKKWQSLAVKLGIKDFETQDIELVKLFLTYLEAEKLDFTNSFRNLPQLYAGVDRGYPKTTQLNDFCLTWKNRVRSLDHLDQINPIYIPRNHLIANVIKASYEGNDEPFHQLLSVLEDPFTQRNGLDQFSSLPSPSERVYQTFCGT